MGELLENYKQKFLAKISVGIAKENVGIKGSDRLVFEISDCKLCCMAVLAIRWRILLRD